MPDLTPEQLQLAQQAQDQLEAIRSAEAGVKQAAEVKQFHQERRAGRPVAPPRGVPFAALAVNPPAAKVQENGLQEPFVAPGPSSQPVASLPSPSAGVRAVPLGPTPAAGMQPGVLKIISDGLEAILEGMDEEPNPWAGELRVYVRLLKELS